MHVNKQWCELVGYGESEILTMNLQDITGSKDLVSDLSMRKLALEDGKNFTYSLVETYIHKGGINRKVKVIVNSIYNEKEVTGFIVWALPVQPKSYIQIILFWGLVVLNIINLFLFNFYNFSFK